MNPKTASRSRSQTPKLRLRSAPFEDRSEWQAVERYEALRETALTFFPKAYALELRRVLAQQIAWFEEQARQPPTRSGTGTRHALGAAMRDLRHVVGSLAEAASGAAESESAREAQLSGWVDDLALKVAEIAEEIERRIVPRRRRQEASSHD